MSLSVPYTKVASVYHWIVAAPLLACVGCVLKAQDVVKEEKGKWMWRHKSLGSLVGILVAPRLGYRLLNAAKVCNFVHILKSKFRKISRAEIGTF